MDFAHPQEDRVCISTPCGETGTSHGLKITVVPQADMGNCTESSGFCGKFDDFPIFPEDLK